MARVTRDSFDVVPVSVSRQGTHRIPRKKRSGWFAFGWAALATGLLVALGVGGLFVINNNVQLSGLITSGSSPAPDPTPTVTPTTDPSLSVTILNGTQTAGLAGRAGDAAASAGWTVGARLNADSDTVTTTTVYYHDPANEAAALGLAAALGGVSTTLSQDFPGADLTVLLGADYVQHGAG